MAAVEAATPDLDASLRSSRCCLEPPVHDAGTSRHPTSTYQDCLTGRCSGESERGETCMTCTSEARHIYVVWTCICAEFELDSN